MNCGQGAGLPARRMLLQGTEDIELAHAALDTRSMAQCLEREYDFSPKQAQGTAIMLDDITALKADMSVVKDDITALKEDMSVMKGDILALDKKIGDLKKDNIWMKAIGAVILVIVVYPLLAEFGIIPL